MFENGKQKSLSVAWKGFSDLINDLYYRKHGRSACPLVCMDNNNLPCLRIAFSSLIQADWKTSLKEDLFKDRFEKIGCLKNK